MAHYCRCCSLGKENRTDELWLYALHTPVHEIYINRLSNLPRKTLTIKMSDFLSFRPVSNVRATVLRRSIKYLPQANKKKKPPENLKHRCLWSEICRRGILVNTKSKFRLLVSVGMWKWDKVNDACDLKIANRLKHSNLVERLSRRAKNLLLFLF